MTKLIRIFGASVAGGLALGWGARALKDASERHRAANSLENPGRPASPVASLEQRLATMEQRLQRIETCGETPLQPLPADMPAVVAEAEQKLIATAQSLRTTVETEVREKVRLEAACAVERAIEGSLGHRLERLETAVETHESRMRELRDCSLRTEQNLQRLMAGIERLVNLPHRMPSPEHQEPRQHESILEKISI